MSNFLQLVAKDLYQRFGDRLPEVTLVFPSRRAGLFFNKYLAELILKPIWSPKVITINELMQQIAELNIDDSINLVTKLYTTYNKIRGINEPFENFYFWGEVMLADFDQVDKYMVNAKQLFSNIKDIKEIEEKFGGLTPEQTEALKDYLGVMANNQISELREKHLNIWGILFNIYKQFKEELEKEKLAFEGMAYRKAADILSDRSTSPPLPNPIAFVGFNALNNCEKALFKRCKGDVNTLFYWDYDPVFVDNKKHEAGMFIRNNLLHFPNALPRQLIEDSTKKPKTVKMVAAPSNVAQTKLVPKILKEMMLEGAQLNESTAVVLPKENILIPTLQAIPAEAEELNITMGYPIKETPAYSIAEFLVKLQMNAKVNTEGVLRFYHKDVLAVLNHPYCRLCEPEISLDLANSLKRNNRIYPRRGELALSPFFDQIFSIEGSSKNLTKYLLAICNRIAQVVYEKASSDTNQNLRIDLEFLYALHKSITRLQGVLSNQEFEITHKVFLQLLRKAFVQERVSFSGEPLAGLQLMGFLETRALDFESIVILSFNDDVLPGRNHPVSFITPSLRFAFGLPDYKHHDAVYAYYFYRLLNRAKNIYLVYNSRAEGLSSGEKSRFGLQLEMEQMKGQIETIPVGYNLMLTPTAPVTIEKSQEIIDKLTENLSKRSGRITLSPSGLTTYITCPLRFYFRYVTKIDEEEEVSEEAGALEFGRIIHKTMEELYSNLTGKLVTANDIKLILAKEKFIEDTLDNIFNEIFLKDNSAKKDELSGRNLLARNAMIYTIKKMLRFDANRAPFTLISHEQEVYTQVSINNPNIKSVRLGGSVDRIEENNNSIWAIDYKTGKHDTKKGKFQEVDELFDPTKIDAGKEVFQTFCYSLTLKELYPQKAIKPAIWFVKVAKSVNDFNINRKVKTKSYPVNDFREYHDEFLAGLSNLLSDIFNSNIPFTQTADTDKCKSCPFINICGREQ